MLMKERVVNFDSGGYLNSMNFAFFPEGVSGADVAELYGEEYAKWEEYHPESLNLARELGFGAVGFLYDDWYKRLDLGGDACLIDLKKTSKIICLDETAVSVSMVAVNYSDGLMAIYFNPQSFSGEISG